MKRRHLQSHQRHNGNGQAESYLRQAVRRIVRRLRPDRIILFGSQAYGHPGKHSDFDLLIIQRSRLHPFDRETTVDVLLSDRPVPIDILVRTPREIEVYRRAGDPFWREVLEGGKILYAARR